MTGAVIGGISGGLVAVTVLLFVVIVGCCWYHRRKRTCSQSMHDNTNISLVLNLPFLTANKHHPPLSNRKLSYKRTCRPSEELRQEMPSQLEIALQKEGGAIFSKGKRPSKGDRPPKRPSKGDRPNRSSKGVDGLGDQPSKK